MTRERALPALDAAHIRSFSERPEHDDLGGLLLRSDVHRLFDAGYVTVTPQYVVEVSHRVRDDFNDGENYLQMHGQGIVVPDRNGVAAGSGGRWRGTMSGGTAARGSDRLEICCYQRIRSEPLVMVECFDCTLVWSGSQSPALRTKTRNTDASEFHEALMRRDHRCAMPTALREGPYRFFFYAGDGGEPPHVRRDRSEAKFWIEPVQVAANLGFADQELNRIRRLVVRRAGTLMEAWHDYFSS